MKPEQVAGQTEIRNFAIAQQKVRIFSYQLRIFKCLRFYLIAKNVVNLSNMKEQIAKLVVIVFNANTVGQSTKFGLTKTKLRK